MSKLLEYIHDHAIARPMATAVVCPQGNVSYAALSNRVDTITLWLGTQNIRLLGLHCNNNIDWILADLAAIQLGIPVIPIPGFFSEDQINHLITDSGLDAILSDRGHSYPNEKNKIAHLSNAGLNLHRLQSSKPAQRYSYSKVTYTSGSTGNPKGVCLSQTTIESVVEALSNRLSGT